ncbi:unnamed protein product, partial [Ascophyllum nodosum]
LNYFWIVEKKNLEDKRAELRNKERELQDIEEKNQATYSASKIPDTVTACILERQLTAPFANITAVPDAERLVSRKLCSAAPSTPVFTRRLLVRDGIIGGRFPLMVSFRKAGPSTHCMAFGIDADQWTTAAQDEGEWRRTTEQGTEHFMAIWIAAEEARAGLRHAVVSPNVTGRTKERISQSKRARADSLALVD